MIRRCLAASPVVFLLLAAGCTAGSSDSAVTGDAQNLTEAPTPRKGSTINSPSVDPAKMYWGDRSIQMLAQIGYLSAAEASVASRADGIIANSPPNGRIGVDELAVLESPAHINTLFPDEKAVIPKLWKILVIDDVTSYTPAAVAVPVTVHDTYPHAPFQMPIASLDASYRQLASRIELTKNSDGDANTISGSDIEGAFGDKGSYLPTEIQQMRQMHMAIATAAPSLGADAQWVEVPAASQSVLANLAPVQVVANLTYGIQGAWSQNNPTYQPSILGTATLVVMNADPTTQIVTLDKASGQDWLAPANQPNTNVGQPTRVEIWKGGVRTAEIDAVPGTGASAAFPFGYAVVIGATKWVLECPYANGNATCNYYQAGQVNVTLQTPPRSYYVAGHPDTRVDLFANGRALVVGPASTTTCYPIPSGWGAGNLVSGCTMFSPMGQNLGGIQFNNNSADLPYFATGQFIAPAFGGAGLYAY
jgi:hypothetical protein